MLTTCWFIHIKFGYLHVLLTERWLKNSLCCSTCSCSALGNSFTFILKINKVLLTLIELYRYFGIQFRRVRFDDWKSIVQMISNISIASIIAYTLVYLDPFDNENFIIYATKAKILKELCILLFKFNFRITYPLGVIINLVYFLFFGPKIILFLESKFICKAYSSRSKSIKIFLCAFFAHNLIFFYLYKDFIILNLNKNNSHFYKGVVIFSIYIQHLHQFMILHIISYYKNALHKLLKQSLVKLKWNNSTIGEFPF